MSKKKMYNSIPRNGLVGEWLLDGNANDTNDGTKNNGTATNVTWSNTDKGYQKQYGNFNGSSSKIDLPTTTALSTYSFGCWIKTSTTGKTIIALGNSGNTTVPYMELKATTGLLTLGTWNGSTSSRVEGTTNVADGNYHFCFVTKNGTSGKVYVDGVLQTSGTCNNINTGTDRWAIGYDRINNVNFHNGIIQGGRVYNRELSQQEIQNLYQEGLRQLGGGSDNILSNAIAYYDFNLDANDIIGGNNGTITGATLTTDRFGIVNRAYSFTGGNDKIITTIGTSILPITSSHTYTFWIKTGVSSTGQQQEALYLGNRDALTPTNHWDGIEVNSTGTTISYVQYDGTVASATANVTQGQLYYCTAVHDGTNLNLYIDGVFKSSVAKRNPNVNSSARLNFGGPQGSNTSYWFNGELQEVIIFNKALSADEVKELYNLSRIRYLYPFKKTLANSLTNGLQLWLAGDNNGTTWYDVSGNGSNATGASIVTTRILQHKHSSFLSDGSKLTGVNNTLGVTGNFTASVWFKTGTLSDNECMFFRRDNGSGNRDFQFRINNSNGMLTFFRGDTGWGTLCDFSTSVSYEDGKWHHGVVTFSTINGSKIYVDGKVMATNGTLTGKTFSSQITYIGGRNDNLADFNGYLANLIFWNRELSAIEIQQLYYSTYIN